MTKLIAIINNLRFILLSIITLLFGHILNLNLIIPLALISLVIYIKFLKNNPATTINYNLLNAAFLFIILFVSSYFIKTNNISVIYLPFSVIPMLAAILFNELVISLIITCGLSIAIAGISGNNLYLAALFLISGLLSSTLVLNARRRTAIIRTGLIIGIVQSLSLLMINNFRMIDLQNYLILFLNGLISSIIVLGVLPIFEYLFKTVTNISLLELADFNHPVLQRLILEAPGTYHHSLIVGNLSEAACSSVGAHALLARVGAYYHDIGKLSKPEYFSENQNISESKHDALSPTISKMVIMNHVKEGEDLAKKYKLNSSLMDFILQHHGTSLVFYFYRKALENIEENQQIREEGFRYPGPRPKTKETAIVLLADSVEAASRALKDPTPAKIEEVVHKVINNKFIDGQLDECDLTLKDLEKISSVFIRILSGIYHSRTIYPEGEKSEYSHKKSAKENSNHPINNSRGFKSNP